MRLFGKLSQSSRCFICESSLDKNPDVIEYQYKGGTAKASICKKCADDIDDQHPGELHDDTI